jgi:predicted aminopeptidase
MPLVFLGGCALLASCGDLGYYAQCATGHLGVMAKCEPIPRLIADPATPAALKGQLEKVVAIRDFASRELGLPENGSYRSYGDLGRPYVIWNVVAAPEFSMTPLQWCFPVAGCVSYRGYFKRRAAEDFAAGLRRQGNEVYLYGVSAYSTLQWFDDPVLNTFLDRPEPFLAGMIFHELAHQQFYVKDDSSFNEAFATTVELEGVRRWLERGGDPEGAEAYRAQFHRHEELLHLLTGVRDELEKLYAAGRSITEMRREKEAIFRRARMNYGELKESWAGYDGFDNLMAGLNNARLGSMSTYHDLVPAFQQLLAAEDGRLPAFYRVVAELGKLPQAERHARLQPPAKVARAQKAKGRPTGRPFVGQKSFH